MNGKATKGIETWKLNLIEPINKTIAFEVHQIKQGELYLLKAESRGICRVLQSRSRRKLVGTQTKLGFGVVQFFMWERRRYGGQKPKMNK